ncbi:zinc finger, CCHC-type containing protein [Tanacetum coccineum]
MHFMLFSMSVVYVLTTHMPDDGGENPTVEQVRKRSKWDNDDYVCRGLILNGMSDSLFDIYQNIDTSKELWDTLKAKYMAEDASSKKFLVNNFTNYKMTDSRPVLEQYNELLGILGRFTQHNMNMDESIQEELTLIELGSHLRIEESLRAQDNDKPKGNNAVGPLVVNMVEHNNSSRYNDNKGKRKHHDTRANPNKKPKVTCWKCGKPGHLKKDCKAGNVGNRANGSSTKGSEDGSSNPLKGQSMFNKSHQIYYVTYVSEAFFVQDDDVAWWVDSGATVHVCKDRCWFKTYESLNDGSILHMGNESTALVHGRGCVDLRFSSGKVVSLLNVLHVPNIRKNLVSSSVLNNCGYKQVIESNKFVLSKHGVFIGFGYLSNHMFRLNIVSDNIGSAFMSTSKLNDSILWHARLGHVHFKRMQYMSKDGLIPAFDMDTGNDLCDLHATPSLGNKKYFVTFIDDASRFCYVYLLHSKDEALDKFKVFKTEVELQQGSLIKRFRTDMGGEYMDTLSVGIIHETTAAILHNKMVYLKGRTEVPNKRNMIKKKPNLNYLRVWGCRAVVRLPGPKLKTLGERGIECIFVGYAEHSKAFRFYVIEPNDSVAINSIIESRDAIFDEHRFSSVPKPSQTEYSGGSVVSERVTDEIDDPKTFDEAMKSQDVAFWKEAINDEMDSIMGNNTWVLTDLPPGCRPLGCKWIFKRKMKVDGTVEKFKARTWGRQRIKHESNGIAISQSHYIEKVLKKFNYSDCTPVSTPLDTCEKLMPNRASQLEYTSNPNPGTQHWQAIQRVLKYLKKTMDYRLVFVLGGGAISWASKKQTCITGSTMESEFVALAAAGKEAEWLKNLLLEIPLWVKPMAPISIRCDSAATLAKPYSQMYNGKSSVSGIA